MKQMILKLMIKELKKIKLKNNYLYNLSTFYKRQMILTIIVKNKRFLTF